MIVHEVPNFSGTLPEQMNAMQDYLKKLVEEINVNNAQLTKNEKQ